MNPNNRKQILIIVAIVVVGLWVADKVIFTPLTNLWKTRAEDVTNLRKKITQNKGKLQLATVMDNRWEAMKKQTLPKTTSEAEGLLLNSMDKWSQETRVSVSNIKPNWKHGATEDYSVLECRVDALGTMDAIARFINQIEHSQMALKVESLELTTHDNNGQQMTLALMISGLRLAQMEGK
ncbi:MAG: hypothetical protein JWN25_2699 [Verrucomicrobiales bacterium]|nr:hypothetical protein [Verrucomicrobiales bacterium]MDB6130561.1 hypothetical protein [Verrucomicrobiales bacterium]